MNKVTVVIPNYNGEKYLEECFNALIKQTYKKFDIVLVDNGSEDRSMEITESFKDRLDLKVIKLNCNYGFAKAVNIGIKESASEYVILLNNDTHAGRHFIDRLVKAMDEDDNVFSAQALMLQYQDRSLVDSAGDYYCVMGVGFSAGKDKKASLYKEKKEIFSACAGAAIYRKKIFDEVGYFPENFFAYLEDIDTGYRARLYGYKNIIVPDAKVLHVGSGSSGSRHNEFKVELSARNNIFLMYRNFSAWQWIVNFIPVIAGICAKSVYFARKKLLASYLKGIIAGIKGAGKLERTKGDRLLYKEVEKQLIINLFIRIGLKN